MEEELATEREADEDLTAEFKSFLESVDSARDDVQAILQLAELALEGGDAHMALVRYEDAIAKEPDNADAWTGKGVALQNLGRDEDALAAYDEALRLEPGHEMASRWRAAVLRRVERGKAP
ncbi:MAG: tetratricopeptide repeat protein [Methanobacteriota archaeon]